MVPCSSPVRRSPTFVPLLVSALSFALCACASGAWNSAREADTAEAYRAFLREHPKDDNADAARVALEEKEFEAAAAGHSILAYKRYLEEFPDSQHASAARGRLEGLRFNAAREVGTAQAWRQFLREHPDAVNRAEAEQLLLEAEFKESAREGAPAAELERLVRTHDDDPRRLQLQRRLDEAAFEEARRTDSAFAYYDYLQAFPAGAHRQAVQERLLVLRLTGMLVSGQLEAAKAALARTPLQGAAAELEAALSRAEAQAKLQQTKDPVVRAALAAHYLRSVPDLEKALAAPDPLDRWQAAEELGHHVTVAVIDPLLDQVRAARNPLIRQHAFDSLRRVLQALPPTVAQYELATRVQALQPKAESPETWVVLAVLLDLSDRLGDAASEYQRAWEGAAPNPMVLRRWVEIRAKRGQPFSSAVAARQLALWAKDVAHGLSPPTDPQARVAVTDARTVCAAAKSAAHALEVIRSVPAEQVEFPEDLARFRVEAEEAAQLARARLADFELRLQTQDAHARTCDDARVADRVAEAERLRADALKRLLQRPGTDAGRVAVEWARERDPSKEIRALAAERVP